ncbi:MAG: hypothetical protein MMC33_002768, partial [Icmadophila ericetorum]|nr:hypothetical protein [Icmadophila ericetorum]
MTKQNGSADTRSSIQPASIKSDVIHLPREEILKLAAQPNLAAGACGRIFICSTVCNTEELAP